MVKFLIPLLLTLIVACKSQRSATKEPGTGTETTIADNTGNRSASTKLFLEELKKENPGSPGEAFIEKYAIRKIDTVWYVGATISTNDQFDKNELINKNVIFGSAAEGRMSVKIPVSRVEEVAGVRGITYIDIDRKVSLRNQ